MLFFAAAAELPRLRALGVLAQLDGPGAAAAAPLPLPRAPAADPAVCYTNLKSVAGGEFVCILIVDGCEITHKEGIRYPEAWLEQQEGKLDWADAVVMYRRGLAGELVEVLRKEKKEAGGGGSLPQAPECKMRRTAAWPGACPSAAAAAPAPAAAPAAPVAAPAPALAPAPPAPAAPRAINYPGIICKAIAKGAVAMRPRAELWGEASFSSPSKAWRKGK